MACRFVAHAAKAGSAAVVAARLGGHPGVNVGLRAGAQGVSGAAQEIAEHCDVANPDPGRVADAVEERGLFGLLSEGSKNLPADPDAQNLCVFTGLHAGEETVAPALGCGHDEVAGGERPARGEEAFTPAHASQCGRNPATRT